MVRFNHHRKEEARAAAHLTEFNYVQPVSGYRAIVIICNAARAHQDEPNSAASPWRRMEVGCRTLAALTSTPA
jgi:hypothetical protein